MRSIGTFGLLMIFLSLSSGGAVAETDSCLEDSLSQVSRLTLSLQNQNLKIVDVFSLMVPTTREGIRKYYQIGKNCPHPQVLDQIYSDLVNFGYPLKYLPQLFGRTMEEVGLRFFQIGDQWNRESVVPENLNSIEKKVYKNVAVGGLVKKKGVKDGKLQLVMGSLGSGFLVALDEGRWAIMTARHVFKENSEALPEEEACLKMNWHFPSGQKISFHGKRWIPLSKELDSSLCELDVKEAPKGFFEERGGLELEKGPLKQNRPLLTMGFGLHKSPRSGKISMERSQDCRLFSTIPQKRDGKWSLPTGCDVSSADSGSPMVDAQTGRVVGVVWGTTQIKKIISSKELRESSQEIYLSENLWKELSMIVPASKILEDPLSPL